ncbi:MAG: TonB-dependent receptor [Gammaproteobacteria bacterium]|nr:TonB-dependent receptor [Gammaproteobacteria bacterium]MYF28169.1 TonB-dependent receptor [Gammaproteobacteria bacterium]MYK47716.1 TonB-dependent receptor [Gammaproteobacteria bacterium]
MQRTTTIVACLLWPAFAIAQQTGHIEGTVTVRDGPTAAGIRVVAESDTMPRPRATVTDAAGRYSLPHLLPGSYRVTFASSGGARHTLAATVLLDQATVLSLELDGPSTDAIEELIVVGKRVSRRGQASIANAIGGAVVRSVPLGPDYRDLARLAPGVQVTQDRVRGPSAGGSGQDNVYRFDGVDVSLPMFGTLSAEPSSHDIDQLTFARGGTKAVGFNRSGGFSMDSTSKSGSDTFSAGVQYAVEPPSLVADRRGVPGSFSRQDTDRQRIVLNAAGPILPSRLFFYASYFEPREDRTNKDTAYGPVKDYANERREYYTRLTFAPTDTVMLNAAYRTSNRDENGVSVGPLDGDSTSLGGAAEQTVASFDGVWQLGRTELSLRFNSYDLSGSSRPDVVLSVQPSLSGTLDVDNLDRMGHLRLPTLVDGDDAFNAAVAPLIERYGYNDAGTRRGGGAVGAHARINDQAFRRRSVEFNVDREFQWGAITHEVHVGVQRTEGRERLRRLSNGWGSIQVPGGVDFAEDGTPTFYVATVEQMSLRRPDGTTVAPIDSHTKSSSMEINDTVVWNDVTVDIGVLFSQDVFYGQGLRAATGTVSGFALAPGHRYRMVTIRWQDMVQPRLGVTWNYNGTDTVFANFARYNPEASSLARAASWDRNTRASLRVLFDEAGRVISSEPHPGSSGKVFQDGLKPRRIDEWTLGTTRELSDGLTLRSHLRRREGSRFWEDTWNGSRGYDNAPPHIAAQGPYVPGLNAIRAEIGGSSYVIAALDDAYTRYWEVAFELEWSGARSYLNASYVYSRYTGNFDQDNTSANNDANLFIGSSNLADGYGRQLWDHKDGVLRGDRPHVLKAFGHVKTPWSGGSVGAFFVYQSGQPWEAWDATAYGLPTYFSSTIRYAEEAGSRRSPSHWQLDLRYTHRFPLLLGTEAEVRIDLFNVFDRQTGYNVNPVVRDATFGEPRSYFDPRRVQVTIGLNI